MWKRTARFSAMLLLVAFPCVSQLELRSVTGIVTDKRGNALTSAVVQLENTGTLFVRSCLTGSDGRYRFTHLYGDMDYTLKAKYGDHWSKPKALNKFDSSRQREVDLVIPIE
ncbi:MAG TPA: carboxypeptidase-like regulatory domain-containing protein [Candidatus Acidoferrales bacterium]|jgi:hypothetical protein|nr:carboxypeptidase-like regulatory domain-containing protein [Candidatus Acidoferrales bacterium]